VELPEITRDAFDGLARASYYVNFNMAFGK
jgi:hypothetical protein